MKVDIKITFEHVVIEGYLEGEECVEKIVEKLPFTSSVNTWGDEIYFQIPVEYPLDDTATDTVNLSDIGYWPPGTALCLFFGKTPMSTDDAIKPASAVNIVGKITSPLQELFTVKTGENVQVELRQ